MHNGIVAHVLIISSIDTQVNKNGYQSSHFGF